MSEELKIKDLLDMAKENGAGVVQFSGRTEAGELQWAFAMVVGEPGASDFLDAMEDLDAFWADTAGGEE